MKQGFLLNAIENAVRQKGLLSKFTTDPLFRVQY